MEEQINILLKTIDGLNATIASLSEAQKKQSEDHRKEVESLNQRIKELTAQVMYLNRQLFGRKAEKLPIYDPNYPDMFADQFASEMKQAEEKRDEAVAEILLQKYEYHMPFYRQIKQFTHLGMKGLKENTIDGWFKKTMELLKPLYLALVEEVMKADYCQADETTTPVIDKEKHKAAKEYLWMVRAVMERLVLFHYDEGSRAGAVIESLASKYNFKGYLQCDGFAGYETAFKTKADVCLVNCMVHIRRHFEQALDENKAMAQHALTQIQHLYKIERLCDEANLSADERKAKRNELARPIMEAMKLWMETDGIKYSESSQIGKAITYAYTRWDNMMHYLDEGRLLLDNNLAENEIRPITLGRKNYLFCGNHEAAASMCIVNSLLATCRNHDVNPRFYLNDIISRMPYITKATHEELVELLPHRWKLQHQDAIMT